MAKFNFSAQQLVARGYLPKELPPRFTSTSFASQFAANISGSPTTWTEPVRFNLGRAGGLRRPIGIPNPQSFLYVAKALASCWPDIQEAWSDETIASSRPIRGMSRYLSTALSFANQPTTRARLQSRARYVVYGDISQCYASIYTHSIDWALMGKQAAKKSINSKSPSPSSDLDKALRFAQYGQTKGIPIGPDSSLVIAELILSQVDRLLAKKMSACIQAGRLPAMRLIDDFEYFARSRTEAEEAILAWETAAAQFELLININKTYIKELPVQIEDAKVRTLRRYSLRAVTERRLSSDILDFFGSVYEYMEKDRTLSLASYAIQKINNEALHRMTQGSFDVFMDLVLPLIVVEPSALPFFAKSVNAALGHDLKVDFDRVSDTLNEVATYHCTLEHGSEVSWCLELLADWDCKVDADTAKKISEMDDNPALLLLHHLFERGLCAGPGPDMSSAIERAGADGALMSSDWLLAYESAAHGWASPDLVKADPFFSDLFKAGISFFETDIGEEEERESVDDEDVPWQQHEDVFSLYSLI